MVKLIISFFLVSSLVFASKNNSNKELKILISYDKQLKNLQTKEEKQAWLSNVQQSLHMSIKEAKKNKNLNSQIDFESVQTYFKFFPSKIGQDSCFRSFQDLKRNINPAENLDPIKDYSLTEKKVFLMYNKYCSL